MKDGLSLIGMVRIFEVDTDRLLNPVELSRAVANGRAKLVVSTVNRVVDQGLQAIAAMLGGGVNLPLVGATHYNASTYPNLSVASIHITAFNSPSAPSAADTALQGSPVYTGMPTITYPAGGTGVAKVRFSALLPPGQLGGVTLTEEGLFSASGALIARTTFSKLKNNQLGLQVDHTLTLSQA